MCVEQVEKGRWLSEHFTENEFACPCCGVVLVQSELVEKLEDLRRIASGPVVITSGYRCPAHNKAVGGVENSYHTRGSGRCFCLCN